MNLDGHTVEDSCGRRGTLCPFPWKEKFAKKNSAIIKRNLCCLGVCVGKGGRREAGGS